MAVEKTAAYSPSGALLHPPSVIGAIVLLICTPTFSSLLCSLFWGSEYQKFRGYLIPRLETATGATWKAVGLSVMLFGFVHLYKGYLGVVYTVVSAVILSVGFCLTRRIWPVAIAHAVVDFIILSHLSLTVGS